MAQAGEIKTIFENLKEHHMELVGHQQQQQQVANNSEAENAGSTQDPTIPVVQMESLAKLESEVGVEHRAPSEIASVELLRGKDGSLWLLSSQNKSVGKHQLLGGFGTGQWLTASECADPGVPFTVAEGDKTIIQLDESSFGAEGAQGVSTLTIYKLLLRAETEKQIVQHKLSFLKVERKQAVEAGQDGFEITLRQSMVFKCVKDPRAGETERISCKNFFSKFVGALPSSVLAAVRYRFERVGQNFKVQRPYVITGRAVSLEKDKPQKLA